jgi:hypothetical protein
MIQFPSSQQHIATTPLVAQAESPFAGTSDRPGVASPNPGPLAAIPRQAFESLDDLLTWDPTQDLPDKQDSSQRHTAKGDPAEAGVSRGRKRSLPVCAPGSIPRTSAGTVERRRLICSAVRHVLAKVSRRIRAQVIATFRRLGGKRVYLNQHLRALLAEAVFAIENELEHRQRFHPQVAILRAARNALYDDLGRNEHQSHRHLTR